MRDGNLRERHNAKYNYIIYNKPRMDLSRKFSGRVIGLILFILVVLFVGSAFNANLEGFGMDDLTNMAKAGSSSGGNSSGGNSSAKSGSYNS